MIVLREKINSLFGLLLISSILFAGCAKQQDDVAPFKSDRGKRLVSDEAMVSSAHPLASEAGLLMLKKGGNAVDAAVATAFALNVVEPNMSGIGGGGSMLIWQQKKQDINYIDFYTSKLAETYQGIDYSRYDEDEFNLLPTGIPGTVDGLLEALEKFGTMSRQEVMAPAIQLAINGFPVYPTLANFIIDNKEKLSRYEGARKTFLPDNEPLAVGEILKQPELANTLQKISDGGASAFYKGEIAENMVKVLNEAGNPVTLKDFALYEPKMGKTPLCGTYKGYTVLSAPLPQTGFYIIQALNVLEGYDLKTMGLPTTSAEAFDVLASTMRLSNADRKEYVTDPNWQEIPVLQLISKEYADKRRNLTGTGTAAKEVEYGTPVKYEVNGSPLPNCQDILGTRIAYKQQGKAKDSTYFARVNVNEPNDAYYDEAKGTGETTHISVVDAMGNAVSLSTTLSPVFGSGAWVNGFILNRSGFNFSYLEEGEWDGTHPYRTRASTISPTIVLKDNKVRLVVGAPGGGRIPTAILQTIIYILEYGLDPLDAVQMPRIFPDSRTPEVQLEKGFATEVLREVQQMGYDLQSLSKGYARLYLVFSKDGKLIGVADPRHDGEVRGY